MKAPLSPTSSKISGRLARRTHLRWRIIVLAALAALTTGFVLWTRAQSDSTPLPNSLQKSLVRLEMEDPIGFQAAMDKLATPADLAYRALSHLAITNPPAYFSASPKTQEQLQQMAQALRSITNPVAAAEEALRNMSDAQKLEMQRSRAAILGPFANSTQP